MRAVPYLAVARAIAMCGSLDSIEGVHCARMPCCWVPISAQVTALRERSNQVCELFTRTVYRSGRPLIGPTGHCSNSLGLLLELAAAPAGPVHNPAVQQAQILTRRRPWDECVLLPSDNK